jgi:hypothetical protein
MERPEMPYHLETAGSLSSDNVTEADIHRAFDDPRARGEYAILTAPDGGFMQAGGEDDGPFVLEHRDAKTEVQIQAQVELTKEQVRQAFLQYLRGGSEWHSAHQWEPLQEKSGCLSVLLVAAAFGYLLATTI